jgi:hypothetical protein
MGKRTAHITQISLAALFSFLFLEIASYMTQTAHANAIILKIYDIFDYLQ